MGTNCTGGSASEDQSEEASSSSPEHTTELPSPSDTTSVPVDSLTKIQRQRLGSALQRFLTGDTTATRRIETVGTRDGEKIYSVLIQSQNPKALRDAEIPLTSVVGETITARLTVDQILTAASTDGVQSVRADKQMEPHQ